MIKELEKQIADTRAKLLEKLATLKNKKDILKSIELKSLYDEMKVIPNDQKASYGKLLNDLKNELTEASNEDNAGLDLEPIDVTAPADFNISLKDFPELLSSEKGSKNPINAEIELLLDIFKTLGFSSIESPEIDNDYNMFSSLNFPEGHPARDDWDTFLTHEKDSKNKPFIAPAHTSTMQHRVLVSERAELEKGKPIAYVIPGRVFRNEDVDARHEHTFYQLEGIYVGKDITVANLLNILKVMFSKYFGKDIELKVQPFYFPFTEPSFELAVSCPFCDKKGCSVCSRSGWIELLGCGMVHPNVLEQAGINPAIYTGFAWGVGINRLVMIKYGIDEIRHFMTGNLEFLEQF